VRRARGEIIPSRIGEREALAIFLDSIEIQLQLIVYVQERMRVGESLANIAERAGGVCRRWPPAVDMAKDRDDHSPVVNTTRNLARPLIIRS
jgi:hypothetical protein